MGRVILNYVRETRGRILSLDLETKVLDGRFLTGETILGFALAWREEGIVRTEARVLEEETESGEWTLLGELDQLLTQFRPLTLVGYYLTSYDIPLLHLKLRRKPKPHWGIENALGRVYVLDLKDPVRFALAEHDGCRPAFRSFEQAIQHPRFSRLPLMRTKGLVPECNREDRGKIIYELWKRNKGVFRQYSLGDAHDALLISEDLFPTNNRPVMSSTRGKTETKTG